jgi:hypothetical protein
MVIAGIKNRNTQGANKKKLSRFAKPASKILNVPLNTHKNRPFRVRKSPITRYPMGEVKKDWTSLLKIANMFNFNQFVVDGWGWFFRLDLYGV